VINVSDRKAPFVLSGLAAVVTLGVAGYSLVNQDVCGKLIKLEAISPRLAARPQIHLCGRRCGWR
jgi:hypothetical protein